MNRSSCAALLVACACLVGAPPDAGAQGTEVAWGASLASRYVWRGVPYSSAVQIQPWVTASRGSVEIGVWGSYGLNGDYKEQDEWISLTRTLPKGTLLLTVTDYYFTEDYRDYFDWSGVSDGEAGGPHTLEASAEYTGPDAWPVHVTLASTFYNDPEPSVYGAVGYGLERGGLTWNAEAGYLFQDGGYYEVGGSGLVNLALSVSRTLGAAGPLEIFATGSVVRDVKLHRTFLVLEVGF